MVAREAGSYVVAESISERLTASDAKSMSHPPYGIAGDPCGKCKYGHPSAAGETKIAASRPVNIGRLPLVGWPGTFPAVDARGASADVPDSASRLYCHRPSCFA